MVRFASAGASTILERLEAMPLAAAGKVSAISIGAIAARLGAKWPLRRDLVHDYLERTLRGRLGAMAIVLKLSDTEILVAQPGATRLAGQLAVLNSLRETLHHFLGEAVIGDMIVHQVTRISHSDIYGQQLDVPAVEADAAEEQQKARQNKADERPAGVWSPFLASDGRTLRVSCRLEPVIQLKTSTRIGHRVAREVFVVGRDIPLSYEEVQQLPRADLERIDYAGVERAIARLKSSGDRDPSLIIPLSLTTLSSSRARGILRGLLTEAHQSVQHGLICEICDIEGAPLSVLADAIAFVRPFSLYVTGRVSGRCTGRLRDLKGIGLAGLSVECPASIGGDAEFIGWMKSRRATLKAIGKVAIVYRLPSLRNAAMASLLGLTHGSFRRRDDTGQAAMAGMG
ncbi:MAG: hypothetical protein ABIO37_10510 [Caulobacteraceae bacterium]